MFILIKNIIPCLWLRQIFSFVCYAPISFFKKIMTVNLVIPEQAVYKNLSQKGRKLTRGMYNTSGNLIITAMNFLMEQGRKSTVGIY
jgi:hypothetical protein